jgi:hypothetical protein
VVYLRLDPFASWYGPQWPNSDLDFIDEQAAAIRVDDVSGPPEKSAKDILRSPCGSGNHGDSSHTTLLYGACG